jgi:hypothetical protein
MVRGDSRKRKQLYCIKISSSIPSIFSTKESLSLENYNSCGMADNHTEQRPHPIEYGEDSFKKQLSSKLFTLVRILSFLVCGAFIIDLKSATNLFVRLALLTCGSFDILFNVLKREAERAEEEEMQKYV